MFLNIVKTVSEMKRGDRILRTVPGDITSREGDDIANAANSHLQHAGESEAREGERKVLLGLFGIPISPRYFSGFSPLHHVTGRMLTLPQIRPMAVGGAILQATVQ